MNRLWIPIAFFLGAAALMVAESFYVYPRLPAQVATHFNFNGDANGWTLKHNLAGSAGAALAVVAGSLIIMPLAIWLMPAAAMNLPHKEYWIDPDRLPLARWMMIERACWFTAGTMTFLAYVWHETLQANLQPRPRLELWTPLGCYLAFTLIWCGEMVWAFARPPKISSQKAP